MTDEDPGFNAQSGWYIVAGPLRTGRLGADPFWARWREHCAAHGWGAWARIRDLMAEDMEEDA